MEGGAAVADEDQPEVQEAVDGAEDEDPDLASFGGKKKKNKKKANFDEETEAAEEVPDLGVDGIIFINSLSNYVAFSELVA